MTQQVQAVAETSFPDQGPPTVKRPPKPLGCLSGADNKRLFKAFRKAWRGHLVGGSESVG